MISSEGEQWGRDQIYPETIYICMDNGIQWDHDCKLYIINTLQLRNSSADILKNCTCFSADEVPRSPIQASNSSMYGRFTNIYPKMTQFCIYIYYLILYTIYILIIYIYIYTNYIIYIYHTRKRWASFLWNSWSTGDDATRLFSLWTDHPWRCEEEMAWWDDLPRSNMAKFSHNWSNIWMWVKMEDLGNHRC